MNDQFKWNCFNFIKSLKHKVKLIWNSFSNMIPFEVYNRDALISTWFILLYILITKLVTRKTFWKSYYIIMFKFYWLLVGSLMISSHCYWNHCSCWWPHNLKCIRLRALLLLKLFSYIYDFIIYSFIYNIIYVY